MKTSKKLIKIRLLRDAGALDFGVRLCYTLGVSLSFENCIKSTFLRVQSGVLACVIEGDERKENQNYGPAKKNVPH